MSTISQDHDADSTKIYALSLSLLNSDIPLRKHYICSKKKEKFIEQFCFYIRNHLYHYIDISEYYFIRKLYRAIG